MKIIFFHPTTNKESKKHEQLTQLSRIKELLQKIIIIQLNFDDTNRKQL
ncbi:hypothetical protein [Bartonella taylorii]|nr:hypothetical protein [Bartonella taylorii]